MKKNILIVAAHPDDEVLGCGGAVALLAKEKHNVYTLILGDGVSARYNSLKDTPKNKLINRRNEALKANNILGVKKVYFENFPDNRFDRVELLDLVKSIEDVKRQINPDVVFTHHPHDRNVDHRLTHEAVMIAFRPLPNEKAKLILAFEIPGSTKDAAGQTSPLVPNYFIDTEVVHRIKVRALNAYKSEMRKYPHPRSIKGLEILAQARGVQVGRKFVEAFQLLRQIS